MTEEQKDRWVAALRSNAYIQLRGDLMGPIRYDDKPPSPLPACCLGVLSDLIDHELTVAIFKGCDCKDSAYTQLDLTSNQRSMFIWLNDTVKLSYEEIALVIENLPESRWTDTKGEDYGS